MVCVKMKICKNKRKPSSRQGRILATYNSPINKVCHFIYYIYEGILTYSLEQSPWEADSGSTGHEIPHLLRNAKLRYRVHKTPPLVPSPHVFNTNSWSSSFVRYKRSLPSEVSDQNFLSVHHPVHAYYMYRQSHHSWFDNPNNILRRSHVMKLLIKQFFPSTWCVISLRSKYSPQSPVPRHPQSLFFPYDEGSNFVTT
jgi:hypothetical protein